MALRAPVGGKAFTPAPEGLAQGVLVDIIDRGFRTSTFDGDTKIQRKFAFRWFLEIINEENGEPFSTDDWLTFSQHVKSKMRPRIESITGRKFVDDDEAAEFDIESLIGVNGQLLIAHSKSDKGVFANIENIMMVNRRAELLEVPATYIRVFKEYTGSYVPDFDVPANSRKLSEDEVKVLNAMPHTIREDLVAAIESVIEGNVPENGAKTTNVGVGSGGRDVPPPSDADYSF